MKASLQNILEDRRTPWGILALALVMRLIYLLQIDASPLFDYPVVDSKTYVQHAGRLAAGNWLGLGDGPFWQPPFYPYFLGVIKSILPGSFFFAARFVQMLCGAISCLLVYHLGRKFFCPVVGLMAGLAAALYGPSIFFEGELLPASLATLLNLAGLALLARALERSSGKFFLGAGAVFGMAAITVSTVLLFVLVAAAWIWRSQGQTVRRAGVFLLGTALVIAPVALRNLAIGRDTVLISYNAGVNFYVGNNAEYPATLHVRPGWEWDDLVGMPLKEGVVRPSEKSSFFFAKSWDFIKDQPFTYVGLLLKKTAVFWHGEEVGRNQEIYFWRNYSSLLGLTLWKFGLAFPFGLVGPLALFGLLLAIRREGLSLPVLFVVAYGLGVILFFVTSRYRMPVVPLLLLLAAYGAHYLYSNFKEGESRNAWLGIAACAVFALPANWRLGDMDMGGSPAIHYNLGNAYAREGQKDKAMEAFERAVELDPEYWQAWFNLGATHALGGDMTEAVDILEKVSRVETEREEVWLNLAHAHLFRRNMEEAFKAYWQALRVNPHQRQPYVEVIALFLKEGDVANAERVLKQAIAYHPREAAELRDMYKKMKARVEEKE